MKILEKSNEKIAFADEIDESLANAIRRSVLEIPVLAIDEVEFAKNDSVLYDEVLALRLGLLPLKNEKLEMPEDCSCKGKGCSKCQIQLKLQAKGKKIVYSKELKGKAEVVYEEIPIVNLADEQELEFVATARQGLGIKHTKFSPGLVYYRNSAEIEVEKNCEKCEDCIKACPQNVLKLENNKITLTDKYKCDLCEACMEKCSKIKIIPGNEIVFFIESWGMMKAEDILVQAVKALKNNLKKLE